MPGSDASLPDPSLFIQLLLRHQDELLRFILPLVGHREDAQDVLQETAKALWAKFDRFDAEKPFLPWAKQFARNEVLMHHRRRRRYVFLTEELIDRLSQPLEQPADDQRRLAALENCLEKLSADDRRLIDRRYADDEATVQELAEHLGRPANVLYKSLGRIRRALLECVDRSLRLEPMEGLS